LKSRQLWMGNTEVRCFPLTPTLSPDAVGGEGAPELD
jgi:hypothetical protein